MLKQLVFQKKSKSGIATPKKDIDHIINNQDPKKGHEHMAKLAGEAYVRLESLQEKILDSAKNNTM